MTLQDEEAALALLQQLEALSTADLQINSDFMLDPTSSQMASDFMSASEIPSVIPYAIPGAVNLQPADVPSGHQLIPYPVAAPLVQAVQAAVSGTTRNRIDRRLWEEYKEVIYDIYILKNQTLGYLMNEMENRYFFQAGESSFTAKLSQWGFRKNNSAMGGIVVEPIEGQEPRQRQNQSGSAILPPDPVNTELMNIVGEIVDWHFASDLTGRAVGFGSIIPLTCIAPPLGSWARVYLECQMASELSRGGMQNCLQFSLLKVFDGIWRAASDTSPAFLVYFWRIALTLHDMRLRGAQRTEKNDFRLVKFLLVYLRILFSRYFHPHPFANFAKCMEEVFVASPRAFKTRLEDVYRHTISCLRDKIGEHQPIVLSMISHHAKHWRAKSSYSRTSIRAHYAALLIQQQNTFHVDSEEILALKLDSMFAMLASNEREDVQRTEDLANDLRNRTLYWCQQLVAGKLEYNICTRGLICSTEWLSNDLYNRGDSTCYEYLNQAIDTLRRGDRACLVSAASFSRRLSLWHKATSNFKKGPRPWKQATHKREEERVETRRKAQIERARLIDITRCIEHVPVVKSELHTKPGDKGWRKERRQRRRKEEEGLFESVRIAMHFVL
ncbi:hypothetical protein ACJ41O_003710 [Fusarium nematophilum]